VREQVVWWSSGLKPSAVGGPAFHHWVIGLSGPCRTARASIVILVSDSGFALWAPSSLQNPNLPVSEALLTGYTRAGSVATCG